MKALSGKKALVTGGTRGIGLAIAERLAADGAAVWTTGTRAIKGSKNRRYFAVDFSVRSEAEAFAEEVRKLSPDILVNNAGINVPSPFADIRLGDFDAIQEVNVRAPMLLCRAAVKAMQKRGWGRIVNITSVFGIVTRDTRAPYSASKFALDGLTASLAAEAAVDGVLANCVAPGFVDTDLTRRVVGLKGMKELAKKVPMKRLARPAEIAALVAWLCGPENTYVSGQNIAIDGGFTRV